MEEFSADSVRLTVDGGVGQMVSGTGEPKDADEMMETLIWGSFIAFSASVVLVGICLMVTRRSRASTRRFLCFRFLLFVMIHLFDYATNVAMLVLIILKGHHMFYVPLLAAHVIIGLMCVYTSFSTTDWQKWSCNPVVSFIFIFIFMGLMQFIQVKLAWDDYRAQLQESTMEVDSPSRAQSSIPARFQCKAMDGLIEGSVFGTIGLYAYIKKDWTEYDPLHFSTMELPIVCFSFISSFCTMGLAAMEVDHRVSASVQRKLDQSVFNKVSHLIFRFSETALRMYTIVIFIVAMRTVSYWYLAFVVLGVDLLIGLVLVRYHGGREPARMAVWLVALATFCVNLWQFVDAPGLTMPARRILKVIIPLRILELAGVIALCIFCTTTVKIQCVIHGDVTIEDLTVQQFFLNQRRDVMGSWIVFMFLYIVTWQTYAVRVKPEADLHVLVADGETEALRNLLQGSDLALDVNRYGPDGRTPLHLAAVTGQLACLELLIEENANLHARTRDDSRDTALHLAASRSHVAVVRFFCRSSHSENSFLNAQNAAGDTALHVAARRHIVQVIRELLCAPSINPCLKNLKDHLPSECAPSEEFRFDRNSDESTVVELLQRAEGGTVATAHGFDDQQGPDGSTELADLGRVRSSTHGSGETAVTGNTSPEIGADQHSIPMVSLDASQEKEFLTRNQNPGLSKKRDSALSGTTGISSFMVTAGMGAMSKAVLTTIREDSSQAPTQERSTNGADVSFDDFTEIKALGEGAFGKVLLVRHTASGEMYALKTMDKAKFRAQKITAKAHTEQFILKTTRHPFIVELHYAFQGTTFWALVMEFCPHGDLQGVLGKCGSPGLKPFDAARLGGEILLAIAFLHNMSVIFRDLKLENVVISTNYHSKITDFGFAKKLHNMNDAKTMCGSYGYVAPEVMLNTGKYTVAVDLYSFGVLMFMLISGGEPRQNNPRERLPPMRHSQLRRRLRDAEKQSTRSPWASDALGGLDLVLMLTSDVPEARTTSNQVKEHRFFQTALQKSVDSLLEDASLPAIPPQTVNGLS
eukprot:TRINITY_DN61016_c0_g1_i1.p1 TRINITY_DN61016_c0_g1~~TRINITY_DN61016_c0_g1_i1.p1  ORF type:complete len:1093 (-),score=162.06 TRINITY_DN61016_c0_g1_i1:87-3200(-)